jgi:hypothetical protein
VTRAAWSRLAKLTTAIVFAVVAGIWTVGQLREREVARHDQQELARMTREMKTVCIGRFLVDMPQETRLEVSNPSIDGFKLSAFDETAEDFQARVAAREAEINAKPAGTGEARSLESVREVKTDGGLTGKIFVHSRTVTEGTAANGSELERYHFENVAVEAMVHAGGVSVDLGASKYDPDLVDKLPRLVAQLVPNPQNKIPSEPGLCIDRAYFRDPLHARQGERIMMFARLPSHPDVEFTLILLAGTKPAEKGLLERNAESNGRLSTVEKLRVSQLRAAKRTIGGLRGDEVIERFDEDNDSIVYSFWWEVTGTADDVMNPHLSFTMDTGKSSKGPVPSSLSQEAAMALWAKISSSIRFHQSRPGQAARPVPVDSGPGKRDAQRGT